MADEVATEIRKYYVSCSDGDFVIEVPSTWKLTFGAVNPGGAEAGGGRYGPLHCLRVWETKEKLRAVFCNVRGIRDLSIPLARKVSKETGSSSWTMDSEGNFDRNVKREIETAIVGDAFDWEPNGDA
jgi:hypothetical protein